MNGKVKGWFKEDLRAKIGWFLVALSSIYYLIYDESFLGLNPYYVGLGYYAYFVLSEMSSKQKKYMNEVKDVDVPGLYYWMNDVCGRVVVLVIIIFLLLFSLLAKGL